MMQIVADHQGRPVMVLDQGERVVGVGEYDAFGSRNRVRLAGLETKHPFDVSSARTIASGLGRAQAGDLDVEFRARLSFFEAHPHPLNFFISPRVEVRESGSSTALSYAAGAFPNMVTQFHKGRNFDVVFVPDNSPGGDGAVLDGYDYDRVSADSEIKYFPPFRFPGQYYDEETDLHENWNRYYEPSSGRYLVPEPLLDSPEFVRSMARGGKSVPAHAYALNNPLRYVDASGLGPFYIGAGFFPTPQINMSHGYESLLAANHTIEYFNGWSPEVVFYGPDSPEAQFMKKSPSVRDMLRAYRNGDPYTAGRDCSSPSEAFANPMSKYVGRYTASVGVDPDDPAMLIVVLYNQTGLKSLGHDAVGGWERTNEWPNVNWSGPMGTVTQHYVWAEPK